MNLNYISKYNPKHQDFSLQSGVLGSNALHLNSLSYSYYRDFSPTPLGSVHVSDDLPAIDFFLRTSNEPLQLWYAARKVGNFSLAAELALDIPDLDERNLARSISLFLDSRVLEARELLASARKTDWEALQLWKSIISNDFDYYLYSGSQDLLIRNPLLYRENLSKNLYPELIAREHIYFPEHIKGSANDFLLVLFIYFENHCYLVPEDDIPNLVRFVNNNPQLVGTSLPLLESITKRVGISALLDYLSNSKSLIPLTSEIIQLLTRKNSYHLRSLNGCSFPTDGSIIIKPGRGCHYSSLPIRDSILESVLLHRYTIKDRNTSDYGNRFYTSDLCFNESPLLWLGEEFKDTMHSEYMDTVLSLLNSVGIACDQPAYAGCWFDASFTHGQSKIDPHFHTAGQGRSYLATAVLYLDVPQHRLGDGGLFFESNPGKVFEPSTGDVVFFPPWLVHGTTPLNTDSLRITLNFDLVFPTSFFRVR